MEKSIINIMENYCKYFIHLKKRENHCIIKLAFAMPYLFLSIVVILYFDNNDLTIYMQQNWNLSQIN